MVSATKGPRKNKFTEFAPGFASDWAGPEGAKAQRILYTWGFRN